ncbi:MAG: hypothetical protein M5U09_17615 [Gammaproteobacteria bacterium]|nr:hypothetical protein [Gammaproteobacteria bacterium]
MIDRVVDELGDRVLVDAARGAGELGDGWHAVGDLAPHAVLLERASLEHEPRLARDGAITTGATRTLGDELAGVDEGAQVPVRRLP